MFCPIPQVWDLLQTGTLTFNNTNSSIVDVFTLPKDSITYGGSVNVNHDTATFGTENFVTNSSSISGDLLMEMPFLFYSYRAWVLRYIGHRSR